ncbi:hypothetical protein EMCG_08740 [[Emmonsia] crescens]|uniref:Uncharacterized protein n=1 Tax=[Emmonsia] crescens TaxID=73230 RepID=A0A0G2I4S2_9EURO|nr:hypothetical protein EMCG_08740 [Emmonsia crescens UAMH 3008]
MNHQHTKLCNCLSVTHVNKLVYIAMNACVLCMLDNQEYKKTDADIEADMLVLEETDLHQNLHIQNLIGGERNQRIEELSAAPSTPRKRSYSSITH